MPNSYSLPPVIQCVELASQRAAGAVHGKMKRGFSILASVAATASFIGFFGTVLGLLNSFPSLGTSQSAGLAITTERISEAMVPGLLGLFVAVTAFCFYRYLGEQLAALDLEMENEIASLVNRLVVHLAELRIADPGRWAALSRKPGNAAKTEHAASDGPLQGPRLLLERMYRHGVLELVWPQLDSASDAESSFNTAFFFCLAYGILGYAAYWIQHRSLSAFVILALFAVAGSGIKKRSTAAILSVATFLFIAGVSCIVAYGFNVAAFCFAVALLPFVGTLKAKLCSEPTAKNHSTFMLRLQSLLLTFLTPAACVVILFGTVLALLATPGSDNSMYPTIHAGDDLIALSASLTGTIQRTDLLEVNWGGLGSVRVAGLPGDRIQVKSGRLIRNGVAVPEPFCRPFTSAEGDFPLPAKAYADEILQWSHFAVYGNYMNQETVYIVPKASYFLLNDNRSQLSDSRTMGPLPREYIVGKLILAYRRNRRSWSVPELLRLPAHY